MSIEEPGGGGKRVLKSPFSAGEDVPQLLTCPLPSLQVLLHCCIPYWVEIKNP